MYSINQFQNTEVNRKYLCRIIFISVNKHFLATIARGQKKRYCSISKPHTVNAFLRVGVVSWNGRGIVGRDFVF